MLFRSLSNWDWNNIRDTIWKDGDVDWWDAPMPPALVTRARLVVDSRAAALVESGDVVQGIREGCFTEAHIVGELGDVVLGRIAPRRSPHDVTVFKSLGMAVEDVAAADLVYRRALETGAGTALTL